MLYLVPTPIGNLEDMTLRALRVLKEVDRILAEDTRVTRRLLQHYGISTPLSSFPAHNEHKVTAGIVQELTNEVANALVSAAGTPGSTDAEFFIDESLCARRGGGNMPARSHCLCTGLGGVGPALRPISFRGVFAS